jgi:hypothetical protein
MQRYPPAVRYLLLVYTRGRGPAPGSPEFERTLAEHGAFMEECIRRGVFRGADPLRAPDEAVTVRVRDGEALVTDGPFAETTEWLGGYYLLECSREEAVELAGLCPSCRDGDTVEVRPVHDLPGPHTDRRLASEAAQR